MTNDTLYTPKVAFHPGETLREKLEETNISVEVFAQHTDIPAFVIEEIIAGNMSISTDMAMAFEQETGIPAAWWLRSQHTYDEYALASNDNNYKVRLSSIGAQLSRIAASIML